MNFTSMSRRTNFLAAAVLCFVLFGPHLASAKTLRLFVLTGQSNALGTPTTTDTNMILPRIFAHVADTNVPFFWDNTVDATPAGDAALGDSGGQWTNICPQLGGYYAFSDDHWGTEVGFARMLRDMGYRDFGIVKAARGGGGNSFWNKTNADHHMYSKVLNTVSNAVRTLPAGYTNHQVVALLYLQGESNNSTEANEADIRFAALLTNLQTDLSNAASMKAVFGQIASDTTATNRITTTQKQSALAAARADIGFAVSTGLAVHNVDGVNVHYSADSLIVMGERMAAEALLTGALPEKPFPAQTNLFAWYCGDHGVVPSSNSTVLRWDDLLAGSTNRDFQHVLGAPQMVSPISLSVTQRNFVRFSGSDGIYATKTEFGILTNNRTIIALARVNDANTQGFLFDASSYSPGLTRVQVRSNVWQVGTSGTTNSGYGPAAGAVTTAAATNAWLVHSFIVQTNGGVAKFEHYINGTQVGNVTLTTNGAQSGLILGANASQQFPIHADVAELLVFDSALSPALRTSVENYLTNKWSAVIAITNAPPTNPPPYNFVTVFARNLDGYGCHRIPGLVTTTNGTVIAVADGRIGGCADIPGALDLVCKRSFDNGATWGALQVIANYGSDSNDVDTYPYYGVTNPIPRTAAGDAALLLDRTNGRVWVLYDNGAFAAGQAFNRVIKLELRYSDDDGATWSSAMDIEALYGLRPSGSQFLTGPGNGIQLTSGAHAGRLIFPVYVYNGPYYSATICSDDHGQTWFLGSVVGDGGGEVQIAETPDGGLFSSLRDSTFPEAGVRHFSRSTDGGDTWGAVFFNFTNPPSFPDPACQGSIIRLSTTNDSNASRLIHANAASATTRAAMTLRISYDEGYSWPVSNRVYAGVSAYSALTKLATGDVGLLFEADSYQRIDFVRASVNQISGGGDSLPAYTVWASEHFTPPQLMNPAISAPTADPDGDGLNNNAEFIAGTNPLDNQSSLRLGISPTSTNSHALAWAAVSNKSYTVQTTSNLAAPAWQWYQDISARPSNSIIAIPVSPTNTSRFFRLTTPQQP